MSFLAKTLTWTTILAGSVSVTAREGGESGDYLCADKKFANEICGVKRQTDCKVGDGSFHFGVNWLDYAANTTLSSSTCDSKKMWLCSEEDEDKSKMLSCPEGHAIDGVCGSDSTEGCRDPYCNAFNAVQGISCSQPKAPFFVDKRKVLMPATNTGEWGSCNAGYVACGSCMSDGNNNKKECSGDWNQLECCQLHDCTPDHTTGSWKYIGSNVDITYEYGMELNKEVMHSESFTNTVTSSISGGFKFVGIEASAEVSQEHSHTIVQETSTAFSVSYGAEISPSPCYFEGTFALWQFVFDTPGTCPSITHSSNFFCTEYADSPPCCLPGYIEDNYGKKCRKGSPNLCSTN